MVTSFDFQSAGEMHAEVTQKDFELPFVFSKEKAMVQTASKLKASLPQSLQEGVTLTVSTDPVAQDFMRRRVRYET